MSTCEIRFTREAWDKLSPEEKAIYIDLDREARGLPPRKVESYGQKAEAEYMGTDEAGFKR